MDADEIRKEACRLDEKEWQAGESMADAVIALVNRAKADAVAEEREAVCAALSKRERADAEYDGVDNERTMYLVGYDDGIAVSLQVIRARSPTETGR